MLFGFFCKFIFVIASSSSCSDRILCWSVSCPTHSVSLLKNSHFSGFILYPAFSNFFIVSLTSASCSFKSRFVAFIISSSHAGCLYSSFIDPFLENCWDVCRSLESFQETQYPVKSPPVTVNIYKFLVFSSSFNCP